MCVRETQDDEKGLGQRRFIFGLMDKKLSMILLSRSHQLGILEASLMSKSITWIDESIGLERPEEVEKEEEEDEEEEEEGEEGARRNVVCGSTTVSTASFKVMMMEQSLNDVDTKKLRKKAAREVSTDESIIGVTDIVILKG